MARPGIGYADVMNAAQALQSRGEHPSIQRVREYLGTGSNSTIAGHLKQWQQDVAAQPHALPLPGLPEALAGAVETFWGIALEQADKAYQELRETAQAEVGQATEQRNQALADRDQALADVESLRRSLAESRNQARQLDRDLLLEQERRSQAEQAIAGAEERAQQAGLAMEQARTEAHQQIQRLEAALLQVREDARQQAGKAEQRLNDERQRGEDSETRLLQIIDRLRTEQNVERKAFAEERAAKEAQTALWQRTMQQQVLELATVQERRRALEAELASLRDTLSKVEQRALERTRLVENLRGKLRTAATVRARLEANLAEHQTPENGVNT